VFFDASDVVKYVAYVEQTEAGKRGAEGP
jgi:hypothetical protein